MFHDRDLLVLLFRIDDFMLYLLEHLSFCQRNHPELFIFLIYICNLLDRRVDLIYKRYLRCYNSIHRVVVIMHVEMDWSFFHV